MKGSEVIQKYYCDASDAPLHHSPDGSQKKGSPTRYLWVVCRYRGQNGDTSESVSTMTSKPPASTTPPTTVESPKAIVTWPLMPGIPAGQQYRSS